MEHKTATLSVVLISVGLLQAADAQNTGSQAPAADKQRLFEEIIVTAQKREESAQDVPISISAFSGETLSGLGINESGELGQFVPGLEISNSSGEGSQLILFLRGAGLNDFNTNNAGPVAIYSDEVYISSPALTPFQFFDTERLEILKGPQGTLYGRNTTGGAIKFVSKKPTDELELRAKGSLGNFGTSKIELAASGPVSDSILGRFAVVKADSDGFGTNLVDGSDTNGVDTLAWRGILDIDVGDNLLLRANVHGASVDSPATKFNHVGVNPDGSDALGYIGTGDPFRNESNLGGNVDLSAFGAYLEASWSIGDIELTSVSAYDEVDRVLPEETDASPLDLIFINYDVESEMISQEFRAAGGNDSNTWLLGAFFLTEDLTQNQTIDLFRTLRAFTGGLADPAGTVTGAPILFARSLNDQETETFAIFGQMDFDLSDQITLTVGARYTDEKKTFSATGQLEDEDTFGPAPIVLYQGSNLEAKSDEISWRLGLDYSPNDDTLIYGSVARGFKSGGFNGGFLNLDPVEATRQLVPYEPEFLTAYELGIKSEFMDSRLVVNGSIFFNDFEDIQVFTQVNTGALPILVLENASAAEVVGLELDVTYYPVDGLTLNLSTSFLDGELKNFVSGSGDNFSGNKIPNTPDTSVSGLARYDFDVGTSGSMYVQGSFAYRDDIFFSNENLASVGQEGYTLTNARVGYLSENGVWGLAVYGNNLSDEAYLTNVSDLRDFGFFSRTFATPRTYGIEFTVDF